MISSSLLYSQEPSNFGSPYGEGSSSNSDDSQDNDADADMEVKREELKLEPSQQKQYSPWNRKHGDEDDGKDGRDDEMETRQNDEIPTRTPDESQHMDNLGVQAAAGPQAKGAESSAGQESSRKEVALEQLEEIAIAQQQNTKVFWWFTSLWFNGIISSTNNIR